MSSARDSFINDAVHLALEINMFKELTALEARKKRLSRIMKRYSHLGGKNEFPAVADLDKIRISGTSDDFTALDEVLLNCHNVLIDIFEVFKTTPHFKRFTGQMSGEMLLETIEPVPLTPREGSRGKEKETIESKQSRLRTSTFRVKMSAMNVQQLDTFRTDRNLTEEDTLDTLDKVLRSENGRGVLKRFAANRFLEELVLFWLEVEEFKKGNLTTPAFGTQMLDGVVQEMRSLQFRRASRICEKYIQMGSPMQVNISSSS